MTDTPARGQPPPGPHATGRPDGRHEENIPEKVMCSRSAGTPGERHVVENRRRGRDILEAIATIMQPVRYSAFAKRHYAEGFAGG